MAKNRRNIILRIQDWIESVAGQTFLNYAYSWGAAVVILGALFKLTHIPGANAMLFIGMGTEVVVFFISGFDRPAALKREEELERAADSEDDWVSVFSSSTYASAASFISGVEALRASSSTLAKSSALDAATISDKALRSKG